VANQSNGADVPANVLSFPKTLELEQRLARNELTIQELRATIDVLNKRIVSLQAQVDTMASRMGLY
jgi:uncharacterized coiled-coil protein SlyX